MFTVKYNRTTNHIDGLAIRSTGGGNDMGDHVSDYALSACPSLTRYNFADGAQFEDVEDALEAARKAGGRKLCKHCEKAAEAMIEAERVAREERLNRDPRGDEWMGRTIGDAVTVTLNGRTFDTELTGADHITPGWTVAYVDEDGNRTDSFVVVTDADIAEDVTTHVSSLVESATHDDDNNEGGSTMAAKKLKLKDVRGDIRIGSATGSNGTMHALKAELDADGRNVTYCPTKFKTPVRSFGPAMDQKPELELCAGCSKVVPTGDVIVTEEPVKIPGLNLTVSQKKITPVEGANEGENVMPAAAKKTAAATPEAQDVDAQISRVHEHVDAIKAAESADVAEANAGQAEDLIAKLPTKHRNTLRATVSEAKKAKLTELNPAPAADAPAAATAPAAPAAKKTASKAVAKKAVAEVAEDFNKFDGVTKLVKDGVKFVSEGIDLGLKMTNVGERLAHTMLDMRTRIPNPDANNLPDLTSVRKTTKNSHAAVWDEVRKSIADDDVERLGAFNSLQRATQNKASDVLCDWLESFNGPDREETLTVMRSLFPGAVAKLEANAAAIAEAQADADVDEADYPAELKPSDAIRALYEENGVELPKYGRTELARIDRRVKKLEATTKELEALKEADDADASKVEELEGALKELTAEIPAEFVPDGEKEEKTEGQKTVEALAAVKTQLEKAGKRFGKVKSAADKRKAKAELYSIIRAAADAFDLDLSALVTSDDED
jgi:hypothetical protein